MEDMSSFLNPSGGQKIAMLSMAVNGPESIQKEDDREKPPKIGSIAEGPRINLSWQQQTRSWRDRSSEYIFAEGIVARGFAEDDEEAEEPESPEATRDRHEPIVSRWGTPSRGHVVLLLATRSSK
jgi:hypothetical protein